MKHLILSLFFCIKSYAAVFSIAQFGDLHVTGGPLFSSLTADQNFVLSNTNDGTYNFVGVISPGDLYDQDNSGEGVNTTLAQMTNWFITFQNAGLFTILSPGNHDADNTNNWGNGAAVCTDTNLLWNNIWGTNFFKNSPGFIGTRNSGDSRNLIMSYTNGLEKFLFLTCRWATNMGRFPYEGYIDQTVWVSNEASLYPDHNVVVLYHFGINVWNIPDTNDLSISIYNGIGMGSIPITNGWNNIENLMLCICGHGVNNYSGHYTILGSSGNTIDISAFNMQNISQNDSAAFFRIWTFDTQKRSVTCNTVQESSLTFLTNLDTRLSRTASSDHIGQNVFYHNWTVPFATPLRVNAFNFLQAH